MFSDQDRLPQRVPFSNEYCVNDDPEITVNLRRCKLWLTEEDIDPVWKEKTGREGTVKTHLYETPDGRFFEIEEGRWHRDERYRGGFAYDATWLSDRQALEFFRQRPDVKPPVRFASVLRMSETVPAGMVAHSAGDTSVAPAAREVRE